MSKHKKYRNIVNHDGQVVDVVEVPTDDMTEYSDDELDVSEDDEVSPDNVEIVKHDGPIVESPDMDEVTTDDTTDSDVELVVPEVVETSVDTVPEKVEEIVVEPVVQQAVNFYKVGIDYINGKCVNQVTSTTNLEFAKETCRNNRDSYKKTYYVFDKEGNAIYTSEYTTPKDNYYRVGTEWKNGRCINQKHSCINIDEAQNIANENTKLHGVVYNVYDPSGKVVFSSKKKLTLLSLKKRGNKDVSWYS